MTREQHTEIANTIIQQLAGGWNKLAAMTGAKMPISGHGAHGGVSFKFGRGRHCLITLEADDTYTVELCRIVKYEKRSVRTFEGVYCDQLGELFESETGLHLRLV